MKKSNEFLNIFVSEYVEIVTDLNVTSQVNVNDDGQVHAIETPLTVAGFVMDADDMFVYLSTDGEDINQAVPLDSIKHIAIVSLDKQLDEMIDETPLPDKDGSYH